MAWQELSDGLLLEPGLVPTSPARLQARWDAGGSAVVLHHASIVVHSSAVPVLQTSDDPELLRAFGGAGVDIYEMATAWTHPDWRNRGLLRQLRASLVERLLETREALLVSVALGGGISPHLSRSGWALFGWAEAPYFSSLIGMEQSRIPGDVYARAVPDAYPPRMHPPFTGLDLSSWSCIWVSSRSTAQHVDERIAAAYGGDLGAWQRNVLDLCRRRGPACGALRALPG